MPENEKKQWVDLDLFEIELACPEGVKGIGPAFVLNTIPDLADQDHAPQMSIGKKNKFHLLVYTNLSVKEIKDKLVEEVSRKG